jgi:hypothetical protein
VKGIELCERFYLEYGAPMLKKSFGELDGLIAVGVAGSGSECLGYDDEISRDHDFEAGFCIFIPDEDLVSERDEFLLERAYSKLPKEFLGFEKSKLNPVGGNRHGVIRISKFFKDKVGDEKGNITTDGWFYISEQFLLEATNGKIFCDNLGLMTEIREKLSYLPEDIRLKKLAGNILVMAQSGQYNYKRCIDRQEPGAAQLAIGEFVNSTLKVIFLLNKKYMPYYKWSFRALKDLELLSELSDQLEYLISSVNTEKESEIKIEVIENIASSIIEELKYQDLTCVASNDLVKHAYSINDKIKDTEIRTLNVMYAV